MKRKVLIPTKLDAVAKDLLAANGNYEVVQEPAKGDDALKALAAKNPDTYALIVRSEKVTPAVMDALPNLKVVIRAGAGYDNIDTKHARSKGIDVMNTPGANANAVAEEAITLMLADARYIVPADISTRAGKWEKDKFMGRELTGKTVGIVGLGNIGRLVARRLSGFDVKLLGYDPVISADRAEELNVELVDLPALFKAADYVTLHLPETKETKRMVGETLLRSMKNGATIVNCARAGIIDETALRAVKQEKKLRLLNDVYEKDAEGPKSIADLADIMMPHLGASTFEANENAARRAAEELIEFDARGVTSFVVNRDIPHGLDEAYCTLANTIARLCRCLLGGDTTLKEIETSMYGTLEPYADWLIVPIVAGIQPNFQLSLDNRAALEYLKGMGVSYLSRKADPKKGYGGSITIDMTGTVTSGSLRKVSVRGTITEGHLMVSRINEFDKLYFEPKGNTVFFLYDDRPGVIGAMGAELANAGINIEDMRNPHDPRTNRSLVIAKVNKHVSSDVIKKIAGEIKALAFFHIEL
ncbi:MAG: NAD(P)-dependent oxidoreductase [bacterium]